MNLGPGHGPQSSEKLLKKRTSAPGTVILSGSYHLQINVSLVTSIELFLSTDPALSGKVKDPGKLSSIQKIQKIETLKPNLLVVMLEGGC